jgi:hypothetical protein
MRGLLPAIGGRVPYSLRHGSLLEASLVLRDVDDIAHRHEVTFWIDRRVVMNKPTTQNRGLLNLSWLTMEHGLLIFHANRKLLWEINSAASLLAKDPSAAKC